jgi:hypothetical protein
VLLVEFFEVNFDKVVEANFMHSSTEYHHFNGVPVFPKIGSRVISCLWDFLPELAFEHTFLFLTIAFPCHQQNRIGQELKRSCQANILIL